MLPWLLLFNTYQEMGKYPTIDTTQFNPSPVIGVDEAGRGCLAGPVFAGAIILKNNEPYYDSKSLSPEKRRALAGKIESESFYAIGVATVEEIEKINILQATLLAMKRAVLQLPFDRGHIVVDGSFIIPGLHNGFHQTAIIKGDQKVFSISAASILAKVKRDEWMSSQDKNYPRYCFSKHKGYGTIQHRQAIQQYGPCPLHRKTFAGVREFL